MIESKYMNRVVDGHAKGGDAGWSIIGTAINAWKSNGVSTEEAAEQVAMLLDRDVAEFLDHLSIHLEKMRGPNLEHSVDEIAYWLGERGKLLIRELAQRIPT